MRMSRWLYWSATAVLLLVCTSAEDNRMVRHFSILRHCYRASSSTAVPCSPSSRRSRNIPSSLDYLQAFRGGMLEEVSDDSDSLSSSHEKTDHKSGEYYQQQQPQAFEEPTAAAFISKQQNLLQRTTRRAWQILMDKTTSAASHNTNNHDAHNNLLKTPSVVRHLSQQVHQCWVWLWVSFLVHPNNHNSQGGPTLAGMYGASLLGASWGFYLFLYFISYGYAAGIGLPLAWALTHFIRQTHLTLHDFWGVWSRSERTVVQTVLVIIWSVRMFLFLGWREFVTWPALHKRILQVNQQQQQPSAKNDNIQNEEHEETKLTVNEKDDSERSPTEFTKTNEDDESSLSYSSQGPPGFLSKLLCWVVYSFCYLCMISPCFFRMRNELVAGAAATTTKKIKAGDAAQTAENFALCLQGFGLAMESLADWQKSRFKSRLHCRYKWCGETEGLSLWKWSTHPNYLGEGLFWFGTFLSGMISLAVHFFSADLSFADTVCQAGMMVFGFGFILKVLQGATESLDERQEEKYGDVPEYVQFRESHGFFGPHSWGRSKKKTNEAAIGDDDAVVISS